MYSQKHIRFDWAMKRLLRQKANFDVLEGFLSELLMFDVKIEEIIESEGNKESELDKFNRVDLLAKDNKGELILIEVQNERQHDYFHRMNYAQAKLIAEHIDQGKPYAAIKKVYSINIVYFELGQGTDYVYVGNTQFVGLHDHQLLQLSDTQKKLYAATEVANIFTTYYIIKTNNFDNVAKAPLDEWIYFLKNNEIKDEFRAKGIQKAKEKLRLDNLEGWEKEAYDNFVKEQRIRESEIESAVYDGLKKLKDELLPIIELERKQKLEAEKQKIEAEALAKFERKQKEEAEKQKFEAEARELEAKKKLARVLLKMGENIENISKETGLTSEQINTL